MQQAAPEEEEEVMEFEEYPEEDVEEIDEFLEDQKPSDIK